MKFPKSLDAFKEASQYIVGGVNSPVRAFKSVGTTPLFIERGDGAYITDVDGNEYIDFVQSYGPLIFGHNDTDVRGAIQESLQNGLSFGAPTLLETKLAKKIETIYDICERIRFVSSGTEAVMSAIRVARGYTKRDKIVKFVGCYHGHSDALLVSAGSGASTFGAPSSDGVPKEFVQNTLLAHYNDIDSVNTLFSNYGNEIACVIIEPIAGNMGLIPAKKEFLEKLRDICTEHKSLLIFDEVMSGFRADLRGGYGVYDIRPDMAIFGKVIGGGMPIGAFGASAEIMNVLSPVGNVYQAGTLSGNPISISAGIAMIDKIYKNDSIYTEFDKLSSKLTKNMKEIAKKNKIDMEVSNISSMFGFFFINHKVENYGDASQSNSELFSKFHRVALENGLYFAPSSYETSFLNTCIDDKMVDLISEKMEIIFKEIAE